MRVLFFLLMIGFSYSKQCTFIPPQGWEIAELKTDSPHVKIGFLGKGKTDFRPSMNLALEEGVDVSFKEYVNLVKNLQKADRTSSLRDLGAFPVACGNGRLLEISTKTAWGDIKILQVLCMVEENVYILTASVLKEEFPQFQKQILQSFRTLQLSDDLFSQIEDVKKREKFSAFFKALGTTQEKDLEWEKLKDEVSENKQLGPYWAFLILKEGYAKIYHE